MLRVASIAAVFMLMTARAAFGWACITTSGGQCIHWSPPTATVTSFLGAPSMSLANGTATWDQNVMGVANEWNSTNAGFHFDVAVGGQFTDPCGVCVAGYNPAFFTSTICGSGFGDILELVNDCWVQSSGNIVNAPVFVNSTVSWNAYDGPLRLPVYDIRRVLLHELGHVAGLDHPDAHGQLVSAIMNSHVSNLDRLQSDDVNGIVSLYAALPTSTPNAPMTPTGLPTPTKTTVPIPTTTPFSVACIGDCDGSGEVTVNELITLVNIDLGTADLSACPTGIPSGATVDISLIIQAVNNALGACPEV